jgi:hypothetical protein
MLDTCIALSPKRRQRALESFNIPRSVGSAKARGALAGIALALAGATAAQIEQADLQGVYEIDAGASDDIQAAITRGTAQMNFAIRPLARRLIANANPPYQRVRISQTGVTASLQLDARPAIQTPLDGSWIRWIREDGGMDRVSGQWSYPTFVVYYKGEDGARTQKYVLDSDGRTLRLYVELTSPRLPGPIDYTLVYRRR